MPIVNKDGSVYRLRGPNPLLVTQKRWDEGKLVLHNFDWDPVVKKDQPPQPTPTPKPVEPEPIRIIPEPVAIPETPPPGPPPVFTPPIPPEPVVQPQRQEDQGGSVRIHCLPGNVKTYHDELYDERRTTITYGNKFVFDATVEARSDLMLVLWTPRKTVTVGSILYPQSGHARWWRVQTVEMAGVGYRLSCVPSDEQPSFA